MGKKKVQQPEEKEKKNSSKISRFSWDCLMDVLFINFTKKWYEINLKHFIVLFNIIRFFLSYKQF